MSRGTEIALLVAGCRMVSYMARPWSRSRRRVASGRSGGRGGDRTPLCGRVAGCGRRL